MLRYNSFEGTKELNKTIRCHYCNNRRGADVCRYLWTYFGCRSTTGKRSKAWRGSFLYDGCHNIQPAIHDYAEKKYATIGVLFWATYEPEEGSFHFERLGKAYGACKATVGWY